jgi:hypothetical protein
MLHLTNQILIVTHNIPHKYLAEMPAEGMGCILAGSSPVFIVYLKVGRFVLVYICKKGMGESIHYLDTFSPFSVGTKQIMKSHFSIIC